MSASSTQPGGISIAWFRIGDLRITDHEPLHQAISSGAANILPLFCLDNRHLNSSPGSLLGLPAIGPYRLAAILEAVHSLRISFNELGSDLITSTGNTAEVLEQIVTTAITATKPDSPSSSSSAPSITHITLHYYPCVLDLDGKLGKYFEKEVIDSFLKAAAAQGIPAHVAPCTLGGGGGTSILYLPQDISAFHSTAGIAGHASNNNNSNSDEETGMLDAVVELIKQKTSMTDFRKLIQSTVPVRRPLPAPRAGEMPPLPAAFLTANGEMNNCGFKPLQRINLEEDNSLGGWRDYYIAAGGEKALKSLENLVLRGDDQKFSPAVSDVKRIADRVVRIQRPPMSEKEAQERLDELFIGGGGRGGKSGAGGVPTNSLSNSSTNIKASDESFPPLMTSYRESRMTAANGLDTSAMLSCALSLGTLSIRTLYWKTLEAMVGTNYHEWQWTEPTKESPGHHWLLMHLGIRDFFTYYAIKSALSLERNTSSSSYSLEKKASSSSTSSTPQRFPVSLRSFDASGPLGRTDLIWSTDQNLLSSWAQGSTGFPFVDASMRELAHTGWVSNRGRQNVASFLSKSMHLDWRFGAEIFASLLIDHDFSVNWASWAYVAGVGADPRDRVFKTVTQGEKYDPQGQYIATWVPEVAAAEGEDKGKDKEGAERSLLLFRHRPWEAVGGEAVGGEAVGEAGVEGDTRSRMAVYKYPAPIIDPASQIGKGPPPPPSSSKKTGEK